MATVITYINKKLSTCITYIIQYMPQSHFTLKYENKSF